MYHLWCVFVCVCGPWNVRLFQAGSCSVSRKWKEDGGLAKLQLCYSKVAVNNVFYFGLRGSSEQGDRVRGSTPSAAALATTTELFLRVKNFPFSVCVFVRVCVIPPVCSSLEFINNSDV